MTGVGGNNMRHNDERVGNSRARKSEGLFSIAILTLLSFIIIFSGNLLTMGGDSSMLFQTWNRSTRLLADGDFALWDQQIWGGMTIAGSVAQSVFYPVALVLKPFFLGSDGQLSIFYWFTYVSIHLSIATSGMYLLLRKAGYSNLPAFSGTAIALFSAAFLENHWPTIFAAIAWIPFLLLFSLSFNDSRRERGSRRRYSIWTGIVFALVVLEGSVTVAFSILLFLMLMIAVAFQKIKDK
jgi:hypothetical protein